MLKVTAHSDYVEFEVLAKPGARRNGITGIHDGALKVAVTVAPEKLKANAAIRKLLAKIFKVPASSVSIVTGEKRHRKLIRLEGVSKEDVLALAGEYDN